MMVQFLPAGMDRTTALVGSYDPFLVLLSLLAAYLGAFSGLAVIRPIRREESALMQRIWLIFGATAFGCGVFAMHFVGMLALRLPILVQYDLNLTVLSALPAIFSAGWMLHWISRGGQDNRYIGLGGLVGGIGIALMHYLGMMAMRLEARMLFDPLLLTLAILTTILLAILAIYARRLARRIGLDPDGGFGRQLAPMIMALAISGMHFIAMEATSFFPDQPGGGTVATLLDPLVLGMGLAILFFVLVGSSLLALYLDGNQRESEGLFFVFSSLLQAEHRPVFAKSLAIALGVLTLISWVAVYTNDITEGLSRKYERVLELDRVVKAAANDFAAIFFDLNMIVGGGDLNEFLNKGDVASRERLTRQFLFMAQERGVYDQIRLLDEEGKEIIRVYSGKEGCITVAPSFLLRQQAEQEEFAHTRHLAEEERYVSRFTLHSEQGKVVEPHKPILRFAAPLFDLWGRRRGMVILHYLGAPLLQTIRGLNHGNLVYLIDQEGHLIFTPDDNDEGLLPQLPPVTFASKFPSIWNYVKSRPSGEFQSSRGSFIFQQLTLARAESGSERLGKQPPSWKVIVEVEDVEWSLRALKEHPIALIIFVCGVLLSFFTAWIVTLFIVSHRMSEKAAADALRELELQKLALDEHAIVSTTDVRGNITYVNDKFAAISGYSREELIGCNHRLVKSDEHSEEFYRQLWGNLLNGQVWHGEIKNQARDGSYYWVRATIVPFLNNKGKPFKFVSIRTDISAMKAMEQRLLQAKEEAEAATQAKSDFLANMSHEIRTPMNAIIGLSYLCLQTALTTRQHNYIRKVHSAATSLLRIINDILDFSKIEAGRLDMEHIPFTLAEVLENVVSMTALKAQEKQLPLLIELDEAIPTDLLGDPLRLGQILLNLTNNAIKFTEHGEVAIRVALLARDAELVRLQFMVEDSGIGMSAEQVAQLFQPFTQADSSITRKFGGTGLGLTIARRLVEMMEGSIQVESTLAVGSRFVFDVKLAVPQADDLPRRAASLTEGGVAGAMARLSGAVILVAEDNEINQQVAQELLEQANMRVVTARNGREALQYVLKEAVDGVLMDVQMPVMDGLTATRQIRQEPRLRALPILAMTANALSSDREQCLAAGMQDHLAKPLDPGTLYLTLARWIRPATPQPLPLSEQTEKQEVAEETESILPVIDGLDSQAGLQRMNGNRAAYLSLLAKFRANQAGAAVAIREALQRGQRQEADRMLHTLKGVAASVGAMLLQEKAVCLEEVLRNEGSEEVVQTLLQELTGALQQLCTVLDRHLPAHLSSDEQLPATMESGEQWQQWLNLLRQVRQQLAQFDTEVEHTLAALRGVSQSAETMHWLVQLEQQVALYDFEGAMESVQHCARHFGVWEMVMEG
ncbi:MHYT domain-containing protein [Candidatus Magnetaquicoccus inordinatus]|uniref:MHYT domain-containing protein n=1 Tax=Candidatus Magnetaquicoccus inordinatus TaxID=2496818 RepID=UPI00102C7B0C|nr:MHYT domain-containing protein [Candidatus Magnetaquicoccus inordinatus]